MVLNAEDKRNLEELQQWFNENDQLPKEIAPLLLKRFYLAFPGDMKKIKKVITKHYSIRNKNASLFLKRDPFDEGSRRTNVYADLIPLPGLTPEKYKVTCYRLRDHDPSKMNHVEDTKVFFMVADCRFATQDIEDDEDVISEGEVQIFDMSGYTLKHVAKLHIITLRVYMKFLQKALPAQLRAVHMINCPTYLDKIVAAVKPFIATEVYKLMQFHTDGLESLYKHVPRDILPNEYGGSAGSLIDLKAIMLRNFEEKREYLMDPNKWKVEKKSRH